MRYILLANLNFTAAETLKEFSLRVPQGSGGKTEVFAYTNIYASRTPTVSFTYQNRKRTGLKKRQQKEVRPQPAAALSYALALKIRYNQNTKTACLIPLGDISQENLIKGVVSCPVNASNTCQVQIIAKIYDKP